MQNREAGLKSLLQDGRKEEALAFLDEEIANDPLNLDLGIRKAVYLYDSPFYDYPNALETIGHIEKVNPVFVKALILKAYIEYVCRGGVEEGTYNMIEKSISKNNRDGIGFSQLYAVRSLFFRDRELNDFQEALELAIRNDSDSVWMHELLGWSFEEMGQHEKAKTAYHKALGNVQQVYDDSSYVDPTSFEEFLEESIRGTRLSKVNYDSLLRRSKG